MRSAQLPCPHDLPFKSHSSASRQHDGHAIRSRTSEREPTRSGHDGTHEPMAPDAAISGWEQVAPVTRAMEEEGRFRPQLFAPTVERRKRIYHSHRIVVQIKPSGRRSAKQAPVKQIAKVGEPPKPQAKAVVVPIPAPRMPIGYQLASLPVKVDVEPMWRDDVPPPAPLAPPSMRAQEPNIPAPQVEKEPDKPRIDPDELTMRLAVIPSGDIPTLNEPVPSAPVPVPLPQDLDEQIPKEVLVKQQVDAARKFLVRIACSGSTMSRQGEDTAIGRLHPVFAVRLAAAVRQARREGLPGACPFSTYRPPAFGVGGYWNKYDSMHAYGLAADMSGIGRPGSTRALTWWRVVHENGLYLPYGPYNRAEWNHTQLLHQKGRQFVASHPVRRTITGHGPINLKAMWLATGVDMLKVTPDQPTKELMPALSARRAIDRARRNRRHRA
jgi:hypothetical protein